jgi:hypothetical protein
MNLHKHKSTFSFHQIKNKFCNKLMVSVVTKDWDNHVMFVAIVAYCILILCFVNVHIPRPHYITQLIFVHCCCLYFFFLLSMGAICYYKRISCYVVLVTLSASILCV